MNFNDFGASMLTLYPLMVVNNWFVIVQVYVDITGTRLVRLYFILFWFASVMVFLNIVVAFAIEVYSSVEEAILKGDEPQEDDTSRGYDLNESNKFSKQQTIRSDFKRQTSRVMPQVDEVEEEEQSENEFK